MFEQLMMSAMASPLITAAGDGWTIKNFLTTGAKVLNEWGSLILVVLGVVALIVAGWQIVTGLISHGKKQTSWAIVILLIVVGGIFVTVGGMGIAGGTFGNLAQGVGDSIEEIGQKPNGIGKNDGLEGLCIIPYLSTMLPF